MGTPESAAKIADLSGWRLLGGGIFEKPFKRWEGGGRIIKIRLLTFV
jgi:hypothetical protein